MTRNVIRSIIVDVTAEAAYAIWSNFEEYPRFLDHVKHVEIDGRKMRWQTSKETRALEWEAQIVELTPSRRIAWVTQRDGYPQHVVIALHPEGAQRTEVTLGSQYQMTPGDEDRLGSAIDLYLRKFKAYAEGFGPNPHNSNAAATNNWTGCSSTSG
jgi:uncharacterized membrane protein